MHLITKTCILAIGLLLYAFCATAQLSAPQVEAVYGGRIRAVAAVPLGLDSTRLFITTESANSAFFAVVHHDAASGISTYGSFRVIPDMDQNAGLGGGVEQIAAHAASGRLFYLFLGQMFSSDPDGGTRDTIGTAGVSAFSIRGDHLMYAHGTQLHFGTLDASGNFAANPASPIAMPASSGRLSLSVHPQTGEVYAFAAAIAPAIFRLNATYDAILGSSSWTGISPAGLSATFEWRSFGIAPDGRLFVAGSDFTSKRIAYSDDQITWTEYAMGIGGGAGVNLAFAGDSNQYHVYYASVYNDHQGEASHWHSSGHLGSETHPNDGPVCVDPVNPAAVYMTTDMGLGCSTDQGAHTFEINDGIEAVQVKDFDMTPDKNVAWLASKSGIRKVSSYTTGPLWSGPYFPNGDGSPYYAAAMEPGDTNTVYVGNLRVYKSTDGGSNWQQQFSPENAPYHFPAFSNGVQGAASVSCLEVCPYDTKIVLAGYSVSMSEKGGLFYSLDGGANWDQILLHASVIGQDVDVNDVVFNLEGNDTVAYAGVEYDLSLPTGRSVYRLVKNGGSWTVSQDMNAGGTSTGSLIVATIRDLHLSSSGDTIFATGTDAGINHPIAYFKDLNGAAVWTPFPTSGFPFASGKQALAITLGRDTVYCAVGAEIYFHALGSSIWELGYQYPIGTEIHFLYFDELLVGTGTGLYGHDGLATNTTGIWDLEKNSMKLLRLYPNPASVQLTLEFPNEKHDAYTLSVFNVAGQRVYRQDNIRAERLSLDRTLFPAAGMYLIELKGPRIFTGKLLVE